MATIPLVALNVRTPEQPDVMQKYGQLMQLKAAQQQAQMQQQEAPLRIQALQTQAQQGQLGLQQQQREIDSQNAIMSAYTQAGGHLGKAYDIAAQSGKALPGDLVKLRQSDIQMQEQAIGLIKAKGERAIQEADMFAGASDAINKAPPEQKPAVYQQQVSNLARAGVDVSQVPPEYPGDQRFAVMSLGIQSHKNAIDQAAKVAATAESTAKAAEATAQANKLTQEAQYGPSGPAAEAKYRYILSKQSSGQPLSADELSFAKGFEASNAKSTTASDSLGISSVSTNRPSGLSMTGRGGGVAAAPGPSVQGGAPTASSPPLTGTNLPSNIAGSPANAKQSIVDMIGQYKMNPTLVGRAFTKHPELVGMVGEKYPDWEQSSYNAKNKILESYTSGPESNKINAIGTGLGHADELRDAIDALQTGDAGLKVLRALGQKYDLATGGDKVSAFNLIVHKLAPEMTAAYVQGGGGEGERAAAAEDFNPAMSRQQLLTNWSKSVQLLRSKISQDEQQWNTTYQPSRPEDAFTTRFFGAPAKQALNRWSSETGNPSGLAGAASAPAPTEGTTKINSHGDKVKFSGGKWGPA